MLFASVASEAQTVKVAVGSGYYVTIGDQNYKRGDLRAVYNTNAVGDTGLYIIYSSDRKQLFKYTTDTNFLYSDSSNRRARSIVELKAWFNTNFEPIH